MSGGELGYLMRKQSADGTPIGECWAQPREAVLATFYWWTLPEPAANDAHYLGNMEPR